MAKVFFYKKYFVKEIKYTKDLLFDINNIESFNIMEQKGLVANLLIWTGLRKSVPLYHESTSPPLK